MLWLSVALGALGAVLALYSIQISFKIAGQGIVEASGCSMGEFVNCDLAHASSYAELLGIPVAGWGLAFYLFAGLGALAGLFLSNRRMVGGWIAFAWILALGSVVFSLVKAYHLVELGVLCLVCLAMYLINLALVITLARGLNDGGVGTVLRNWWSAARGGESNAGFDVGLSRWGLLAAVMFGLAFVVMKRQADAIETGGDLDMDLALTAHFRQVPVAVATGPEAPVWGAETGDVQVVEFADFQCPACQVSAFHLRTALFEFRDRVSFRFMNFPLDSNINEEMGRQLHAQAGPAARAAICAQRFGDFWEYHDDLFRNQATLSPQLYTGLAEDRGWNIAEFESCMREEGVADRIRAELQAGRDAGLGSTPTIYINGRKVAYWQNTEFIREVIRAELERVRG